MLSMGCESKSGRNMRLWSSIEGHPNHRSIREEILSVPFANAIETLKRYRYVLLAGTLLSTLAVPQWNAVSDARAKEAMRDGSFVIAQRVDPNDPNQKGKQKGQPDPKGQKGQGQPQGQPQAQPGQQGQPSQGQPQGQQKQLTNQPAAGTPPQQQQQQQ